MKVLVLNCGSSSIKYKLYDTGMSDSKYDQSYVLYLNDYESPFMFCSPSGYSDTVLTIAHEFGHYVDGYLNYGLNDSIDTSEVFSQGMEYLLLCNMDDAEQLTRYKMLDELELYAYQACLNEFEHEAYAMGEEELTVERLNSLYAELLEEYNKAMISDRNIGMADKAEEYLAGGGTGFYIVGLAHVVGDGGIIDLLTQRGYTVEKIS